MGLALPAFFRICQLGIKSSIFFRVLNFLYIPLYFFLYLSEGYLGSLQLSPAPIVHLLNAALDTATAGRLPTFAMNLQIYACFLVVLLFCLAFGLNLAVWTHTRINYRFIFEFDARDTLDYHQFFEV